MRAGPPLEHGSHLPETTMLTGFRSSTCELLEQLSDVDLIPIMDQLALLPLLI